MGDLKELWIKRTWFFRITISAAITCRDRKIQLLDKAPQPGNQDEWQPWRPREGSAFLNSVSKFCALKTWGCCKNWQFLNANVSSLSCNGLGFMEQREKNTSWIGKKNDSILYEIEILLIGSESQISRYATVRPSRFVVGAIGVVQSHQLMSQL